MSEYWEVLALREAEKLKRKAESLELWTAMSTADDYIEMGKPELAVDILREAIQKKKKGLKKLV